MIWLIVCGGIILTAASFGAGEQICGEWEEWYVKLLVGFLSIVIVLVVIGGFLYGLHQLDVTSPE